MFQYSVQSLDTAVTCPEEASIFHELSPLQTNRFEVSYSLFFNRYMYMYCIITITPIPIVCHMVDHLVYDVIKVYQPSDR